MVARAITAVALFLFASVLANSCAKDGEPCIIVFGDGDNCTSSAECIPASSVGGWERGTCFETCTTDRDCRGGLTCGKVYGSYKVCWD